MNSSPRISTFAARSLSIQRTSVECETPRSRASFSPETAIVMFCIRAKRSSSSLRSIGALFRYSGVTLQWMSAAGGECVKAPTEMMSTPASA